MKGLPAVVLAAVLALAASPAPAIDTLRIQAARVNIADNLARDVVATLSIRSATHSSASVQVARIAVPAALAARVGREIALKIDCTDPVVREPLFECAALRLQIQSPKLPQLTLRGAVAYRSDSGRLTARGNASEIAGSPVKFDVAMGSDATRAKLDLPSLSLPALAKLLEPWVTLPEGLEFSGTGALSAVLERGFTNTAEVKLIVRQAGLQNADFTVIGEKLDASVNARINLPRDLSQLSRAGAPLDFEMEMQGSHGQFLGGPVLLDFDRNPTTVSAAVTWDNDRLQVTRFETLQRDLLTATGSAEIGLAPFRILAADLDATEIIFPAAYASYLQLTLATTPFNQLATTGKARGSLRLRDSQPVQLSLSVDALEFSDEARELRVTGVRSELYWTAGATGPPRPSFLSWETSKGWGFTGARSRVDFVTSDRDFRLLEAARLPLFDGALIVNKLAVERAGMPDMAGDFDAVIEPISVAPIAKAFDWPEFAGKLSGRIPGLTYREGVLSLQGDLEAGVFDGEVVASNLRVRDPLGQWPRLYADIIAFNLDLEQVTSTFEFGSITGRIDVELKGLETFNWSPVAFDLRIATPKDDRSPHRISQRAVQNLSSIGGGGGGVAAALQSGALQFFDTFGYDQIGLSCRLRNDVCRMSGVGAVGDGYYILRGSGLPRLNIIGKSSLVDWPRFVSQLGQALNNSDSIVVD